jgi:hypothetical protein
MTGEMQFVVCRQVGIARYELRLWTTRHVKVKGAGFDNSARFGLSRHSRPFQVCHHGCWDQRRRVEPIWVPDGTFAASLGYRSTSWSSHWL